MESATLTGVNVRTVGERSVSTGGVLSNSLTSTSLFDPDTGEYKHPPPYIFTSGIGRSP